MTAQRGLPRMGQDLCRGFHAITTVVLSAVFAIVGTMHGISLKCSGCIDQVTKHNDEITLNGYATSN